MLRLFRIMKKLLLLFLFGAVFLAWSGVSQAADFLDVVINEIAWPVKAAYAANGLKTGTVVINEIAWMGTIGSYNDEWLELYNNTDSPINLDGWTLRADDGVPNILLTGVIPVKNFYLLERTDDNSAPDIAADQIYIGPLENSGEDLRLSDLNGNLIDEVKNSGGWSAGNNSTKQTMERKNSLLLGSSAENWENSESPGGTPKQVNGMAINLPLSPQNLSEPSSPPPNTFSTSSQGPGDNVQANPQPKTMYPSGVIINELLPSPAGSDEEQEWIEIFNKNNFEVNLSGWQITDAVGRTNTYIFPEGTLIKPYKFLVLSRPTVKITLNNPGDGLKLIRPDENIIDEVNYQNAPSGESYGLFGFGWKWTSAPTPGADNILLPAPIEKSSIGVPKERAEKALAAASESLPRTRDGQILKFLLLLSVALPIAALSGGAIFFLKRKISSIN